MALLPEDFIFVTVKQFLSSNGWEIVGGEPPDGTCDDTIRILIRKKSMTGRFHSMGSEKIDLISRKGNVLLLTEIKPDYSEHDKRKLDNIVTNRLLDLKEALWERRKIHLEEIGIIVRSLAFSYGKDYSIDKEYVHLRVKGNGTVFVERGQKMSDFTI